MIIITMDILSAGGGIGYVLLHLMEAKGGGEGSYRWDGFFTGWYKVAVHVFGDCHVVYRLAEGCHLCVLAWLVHRVAEGDPRFLRVIMACS
jgi:hypothetical protein